MSEIELFMFPTNARLFFRIQFISTATCAAITAWVVKAGIIAVRWYMQLEVQRTFQGGRKVSGLSNSCMYKKEL